MTGAPGHPAALAAGGAAALAAAVAVPLLRRRPRIPAPVTVAACAAGPLASPSCARARRERDVALFALQMWAFTMVHELPYDDPERLRGRLADRYPIVIDRAIGLGRLPNVRLQRGARPAARVGGAQPLPHLDPLALVLRALLALLFILIRHHERFPRAARQLAAVFDIGCAVYFAVPTAPPWWASEQGLTGEEVRRIMVEVGEEIWGTAWPKMYRRSAATPGRRCPRCTSPPRWSARSRWPKRAGSRARSAGATR